ncbi:hypothetical protein RHGRI_034052 [Rhododendron griersonianum]|uniref:Prokaryotic-type class I peptide chain release factors domain-containing protein n=1 Tax=Rhododendron griersonianum TaxID=479676 RepID=A0AAV6HZ44_9ERIC|nr:hypothetical protein RHGRI_034052 [Rhododendron griersonianum]
MDNAELQPQLSSDLITIMEKRQPEALLVEYSRANKELRNLKGSMDLIKELRTKQKDIEGLKALMTECPEDKEMLNMATEELSQAVEEERRLQNQLLQSLLPKDDADERGCILEVRAVTVSFIFLNCVPGTGGEEASLFAMDIFKMYERYSLKTGWKFDVVEITESDLKGYKVDVQLRHEDLRIDTYRSGGSGGQHVNTTNSAVRITHIPSGITVSIQDERSQHMNKAKALKVLCARLYEIERSRIHTSRSKLRSEQIGSGDRSERIRTYNFPQGRVTDHRVGITHHSINDVMQGENLDIFIDALLLQQEMDAVASFNSEQ